MISSRIIILSISLLLLSSCASPYKRIGSPVNFIENVRTSTVVYGCPSVKVNMAVAGRKTGAWFGIIGTMIGAASDSYRNDKYLDILIKDGIQKHARDSISNFIDSLAKDSKSFSIADKYLLKCKLNEATGIFFEDLPVDSGRLSIDSSLSFVATNNGDILVLAILTEYSTPGYPQRNIIWQDRYVYETLPADFDSNLTPGLLAKKLFDDTFVTLRSFIERDIKGSMQWYLEMPVVSAKYRSGFTEKGHLLQDDDGLFAIRPFDGLIRILPKKYVYDVELLNK